MKNLFSGRSLTALLLFILTAFTNKTHAQVQTARYTSINSNVKAFFEYLPEGYNPNGSTNYPLIVFIHGVGELGAGNSSTLPKVANNGIPRLIRDGKFPTSFTVSGKTHKFIVISPQFVAWPKTPDVDAVIEYAKKNYKVDASRIYLTGLSMGGGVSWDYASTTGMTNKLAALLPVCGASGTSTAKARTIATNNLPVWALHNNGDLTVVVANTNNWIASINTAPAPNPLAKKTIFNVGGHDAWTTSYNPTYKENGLNVYEWMLQYTTARGQAPAPNTPPVVNAGADISATLPVNIVTLKGTATDNGTIKSWAWSKVSGPNSGVILTANAATTQVSPLTEGTYVYRLTVTDDQNASAYDEVKVVINKAVVLPPSPSAPNTPTVPQAPVTKKYMRVSIFAGSDGCNSEWNNWNVGAGAGKNKISQAFTYIDRSPSTIKAELSSTMAVSDNGANYGAGMAPKEVLRHTSYASENRTLTFTGLIKGVRYDVEIYASRGLNDNNNTVFKNGSLQKSVPTFRNLTAKVVFKAITADANGKIVIALSKTATYNYINGFQLTEGSSATTASVSRGEVETIELEAIPAVLQERTALKLDNELTGRFDLSITDLEGNVVKELSISKSKPGISQSYINLAGLPSGEYVVIATRENYREAVIVTKF